MNKISWLVFVSVLETRDICVEWSEAKAVIIPFEVSILWRLCDAELNWMTQ